MKQPKTFHANILSALLFSGFIVGCAPALPSPSPPANYNGPIAEGPKLLAEDYWVFEQGDGKRFRIGAGAFLGSLNLRFPLWVGKWWSYPGEAIMQRQDPAKAPRLSAEISCEAVTFKNITVTAGTFGAFECRCQCLLYGSYGNDNCGEWTTWYAPEVKNIVKLKTESTNTSMELVQYKISGG